MLGPNAFFLPVFSKTSIGNNAGILNSFAPASSMFLRTIFSMFFIVFSPIGIFAYIPLLTFFIIPLFTNNFPLIESSSVMFSFIV